MKADYPQLSCGVGALLHPMAPDNDNAFNPCFLTYTLAIFAAINIAYGTTTFFSPKNTGLVHYIRLNAVALQIILFIYLNSFISIHERFADPKIVAFGLLTILLVFVIFPLHFIETVYSPIPLDILLAFWPALTVFEVALYFQDNFTDWVIIQLVDPSIKIVEILLILNSVGIFVLEYSHYKPSHELILQYKRSGQLDQLLEPNLVDKITFTWMNELIENSYKNQTVTNAELPRTPAVISTVYAANRLKKFWLGGDLTVSLLKAFGWALLLLRLLILYFNIDNPPLLRGVLISLGMFTNTLLQTSLNNRYMLKNLEVGLNCRSSLTSLVYQKALKLSSESRLKTSSGDIINLLSVDVNRVQNVLMNLSTLVLAPTDILLCIVSLYPLLKGATFAGVGVMIVLIPVNAVIVKYYRRLSKTQMKLKDNRSRVINEILSSIKSIKLFAWEKPMLAKLSEARNDKELANLKRIRLVGQGVMFIWNIIPFLVSFTSFATFALTQKQPLTSDLVFPALALLNLLSGPLMELPAVITAMIEANIAINRVRKFLLSEEIDESLIKRLPEHKQEDEVAVKIQNATFYWTRDKYTDLEQDAEEHQLHTLRNINFEVPKGDLSCVVGKVGSGKTSLLYALLGQLIMVQGEGTTPPTIDIRGTVAYCAQQPWIMNASVKENILFGCKWDKEFYERTIDACQLLPDLAILPDGDETQVGEKGVSLSGGQKARLALARAVYARADVYLLDDVLSAVDSNVGKKIIEKVLSKQGLLGSKTIVLSTNSISVLKYSDHITLIEDGDVIETTTYKDIDGASHPKLHELISHFSKDTDDLSQDVSTDVATQPVNTRKASLASLHWDPLQRLLPNLRSGQTAEVSQKGKVKWSVYLAYIKACSIPGGVLWFLLLIAATALSVGANYWLKYWTEQNSEDDGNLNVWKFLFVYAALGFGAALVTIGRSSVMLLWLGINASKKIHDGMARRVLGAPMLFFERTPVGRIMNRFTNDINQVDDGIPQVFQRFIGQLVATVFTIGVVTLAIPTYLIVICFLSSLYVYYEIYYVAISRELKRLVSISRSPIYGHLGESLNGIDTIRAYNQKERFDFIMNANVDFNLKSVYMLTSINRWLGFRLQTIGGVGVFSVAMLSILSKRTAHPLSPSMAGFIMTYAMQVTSSLRRLVRTSAEVETSIVAVERCLEYTELLIEEEETAKLVTPPPHWPHKGTLSFHNYSTRYRANLDLILRNISFDIKPSEKIGIVGRTGAGKSSLALAIFRIIEAVEGNIEIDGLTTNLLYLYDLRQRLSIIPQDSQLLEGTIRQNLDPFNYYTDEEIWRALELAHLKEHILKLPKEEGAEDNKLLNKVYEGGSNFSSGQRQLMSLARVLLKMNDSKILVLDEATAAVDVQTDKIIQETIRSQFKDKTIITIAHRLETVMDSDKIVSLDRGELKEFDSPQNLLDKKDGIFYSLCKQGGYI
ncbi:Bile pigment transporter 1 [Candida viswanathii]|uniref:Bile pigment transporter 1 n=1 Tax=Candida viswanathii TaxID=5486 RepID=A0A367YDH3_9ASCO|nr:Bile pigment transporter 1 [Candida viswanathii]